MTFNPIKPQIVRSVVKKLQDPLTLGFAPNATQFPMNNHALIISPTAKAEMETHIEWGGGSPNNRLEQQGFMYGESFAFNGIQYGVVRYAVPMSVANRSATGSNPTVNEIDAARDAGESRNQQDGTDYRLLGVYHTHPNSLDVFMSGVDKPVQAGYAAGYEGERMFALVMNPHRQLKSAYQGKDSTPATLIDVERDRTLLYDPLPDVNNRKRTLLRTVQLGGGMTQNEYAPDDYGKARVAGRMTIHNPEIALPHMIIKNPTGTPSQ